MRQVAGGLFPACKVLCRGLAGGLAGVVECGRGRPAQPGLSHGSVLVHCTSLC